MRWSAEGPSINVQSDARPEHQENWFGFPGRSYRGPSKCAARSHFFLFAFCYGLELGFSRCVLLHRVCSGIVAFPARWRKSISFDSIVWSRESPSSGADWKGVARLWSNGRNVL